MSGRKSLLVLVLTLALLLPAAAQVSAITHLQCPTGNLVTLVYIDGSFYRVKANGVTEDKPFKPSSQTLIILDLEWAFSGGVAGNTYQLALSIIGSKDTTPVFVTQAAPTSNGNWAVNTRLTAGLTFGSGTYVGVSLPEGVTTTALYLHGYVS
jgi:hypothetical protein